MPISPMPICFEKKWVKVTFMAFKLIFALTIAAKINWMLVKHAQRCDAAQEIDALKAPG